MTSYTLPGYHTRGRAERIKKILQGHTYMSFIVEYGGVADNIEIVIMTKREDTTEKELMEMVLFYLLAEVSKYNL